MSQRIRSRRVNGTWQFEVQTVSDFVLTEILKNPNGGTVDLNSRCSPTFGKDEWCVSQAGNQLECNHIPSRDEVCEWLSGAAPEFELPGRFVGWCQGEHLWLDVTRVCVGRSIAIGYGVSQAQVEIYRPHTGELLELAELGDEKDLQTVPIEASNGFIIGLCSHDSTTRKCTSEHAISLVINS